MRKSFNFSFLFVYILLIFYQFASTLTMFLPPLLGVYFCYLHILLNEKEKSLFELDYRWYFAIIYVLFIEFLHNFYALSCILAFLIFHYYFADWIKTNLKFGRLLIVVFIFVAYLFSYLVDSLFCYFAHETYQRLGLIYLYYIGIESLITVVLFKDKL